MPSQCFPCPTRSFETADQSIRPQGLTVLVFGPTKYFLEANFPLVVLQEPILKMVCDSERFFPELVCVLVALAILASQVTNGITLDATRSNGLIMASDITKGGMIPSKEDEEGSPRKVIGLPSPNLVVTEQLFPVNQLLDKSNVSKDSGAAHNFSQMGDEHTVQGSAPSNSQSPAAQLATTEVGAPLVKGPEGDASSLHNNASK